MGKVNIGLVCVLMGLAAFAGAVTPSPAPSNDPAIIPGGTPAMNTPGIRPGTSGHSLRKLLQAGAANLTTILANPSFAPGPGRRTTIVSYAAAPGPGGSSVQLFDQDNTAYQQITVGTIQDGQLHQTVLTTVPASPPAALSAGRKLLQGSWGWNGRDEGHRNGNWGSWNGGEHRGNDNRGGWGGNNAGQGSGSAASGASGASSGNNGSGWSGRNSSGGSASSGASGASSGNGAAAASAADAVANKGGSGAAAAAAAASAAPGSAAASAAAAAAASGKDASAVAAAAASASG